LLPSYSDVLTPVNTTFESGVEIRPRIAIPAVLSYSLRVSLLVEIAEKAHVSVEGVVRVLTREPVSDAIKERVLVVLDDLSPEETRVLQRWALAAVHDALPRPGAVTDAGDSPHTEPGELTAAAGSALVPRAEAGSELTAPAPDAAHLVQLSSVLEELAEAVRDLRHETDTERRERVDDLAVLIELISTGWQGLDRRLGRLERQLGRLESARPEPARPPHRAPVAATPPPPAAEPAAPVEPSRVDPGARAPRDRLPLAAAVALVGLVVGTIAVLQLVAGDSGTADGFVPGTSAVETTGQPAAPETTESASTAPRTTTRPRPRPARTTTSGVLGTDAATPSPQKTPATPVETRAQTPVAPTTTTTSTTTTAAEAPRSGFRPTRDWAWAPVADADYYSVQFLRGDTSLYRTTTEQPRLSLPDSVVFRPGSYRWIVRPGTGSPSADRLGAPVVDSRFTVQ
jgi:hypothetical protein